VTPDQSRYYTFFSFTCRAGTQRLLWQCIPGVNAPPLMMNEVAVPSVGQASYVTSPINHDGRPVVHLMIMAIRPARGSSRRHPQLLCTTKRGRYQHNFRLKYKYHNQTLEYVKPVIIHAIESVFDTLLKIARLIWNPKIHYRISTSQYRLLQKPAT
jgi:hypothetical protein